MPNSTIHMLLAEQDFCLRINHGMTLTDRRKADVPKIAAAQGWITPITGRVTEKKARFALEELVFVQYANFPDYEPTQSAKEIIGEVELASIQADAQRARAEAGL